MGIKEFIKKIQGQPERTRKIILWSTVVAVGLMLIFLWIWNVKSHLKEFQKEKFIEDLGVPSLEEKIKNLPSLPTPPLDLKNLEIEGE